MANPGTVKLEITCQCGHSFEFSPVIQGASSSPDEHLMIQCPNCKVFVNRGYGATIQEAEIEE